MQPSREPNALWRRWTEIDRVFEDVLEHAPEQRAGRVEELCGTDGELARAVLALLERVDEGGEPLGPPSTLLRRVFTDPEEPSTLRGLEQGEVVGRFRVVRELGRGGMAIVYEAERVDGAYDQSVALKVLGRDLENDEAMRRFLVERQILSGLAHPNIARLLDGGSTDTGHPWLAMELVRGQPLTTWAERHGLTVEQRLELFVQVAAAVGYAHRHLVVHRDLKPANVLVNDDGRVKLLDFGIAKLLDAGAAPDEDARAATLWMTPRYASPEQILGQPVTTASDVHALGVILYELLTGQRPFGAEGTTAFEVQRAICEGAVDNPSVAALRAADDADAGPHRSAGASVRGVRPAAPRALARRLRGDLDAIVMKALRKEPAERYATVQAMAEDVERHLGGFPLAVRGDDRLYRFRRFIRRNWLSVSAAAVVFTSLAGGALLLARQQAIVVRERDRAEREAENAGLVIDFLADVFRGRDPTAAPADTITARELLAWGTERVDQEFAERPEVHAELLAVLGQAHANLGLPDQGTELAERSLSLIRGLYGESSAEVADGLVRLGGLHRAMRDFEAALPMYEEAVRIRRAATLVRTGEGASALGSGLRMLAIVKRDLGRLDEAEALLREATALHEGAGGGDEGELIEDELALAYVLRAQGRLDEAEALYEAAIPRLRAISGPSDPELSTHLNNLAYLRRVRGDFAGAESLYRDALEISRTVYGRGHPNTLMQAGNLASVLHEQGRPDELVALLRERVEAAEAQWPDGHWRVGSAKGALGSALLRNGRAAESVAVFDEAVEIYTELLGADHDWTVFERAERSVAWIVTGREAEGRDVLERLHRGLEARAGEKGLDRNTVGLVEPLVYALEDTGLRAEADRFRALLPDPPSGG